MYQGKLFLAIIPARGGSKRLPRKNVLNLGGRPLIAWTIEAGLKSCYIDKIVVSSDDDEILGISQNYGLESIRRPVELASDTATTFDAIRHAIENTESKYDYIVLLQPTSPLRNENHIDDAIELLMLKSADAVISVCAVDHSPLWANTLPEDGDMSCFLRNEIKNKRSQDLEKYYRINGAIYICLIDRFLQEKTLFIKDNIFSYHMDMINSIDIDEKINFEFSEYIINKKGLEC